MPDEIEPYQGHTNDSVSTRKAPQVRYRIGGGEYAMFSAPLCLVCQCDRRVEIERAILAGYGYDWYEKTGETIGWTELQALVKKGVKLTRDEETQELTARYTDDKGRPRELWFCDAGSYRPKYALIKKYKLAGLAMWRFGAEDPKFWQDVKQFKYAKDWK
jgi:hypothetical protein